MVLAEGQKKSAQQEDMQLAAVESVSERNMCARQTEFDELKNTKSIENFEKNHASKTSNSGHKLGCASNKGEEIRKRKPAIKNQAKNISMGNSDAPKDEDNRCQQDYVTDCSKLCRYAKH